MSWDQLHQVVKEQRQIRTEELICRPVTCPHEGHRSPDKERVTAHLR
jgi:hypothetical protein